MKYRNFCMTLWLHMTEKCWTERLKEMIEDQTLKFVAYGEETCPETGTLHYQAYCSFPNQRSLKSVRKLFEGNHVEPMAGTLKENEIYCSKEGSFVKLGSEPHQGERTDLNDFKRRLDEGEQALDIAETPCQFVNFIRYHQGLEKYQHHVRMKRIRVDREKPKVYIRTGESDSGKTRWLDEQFGPGKWARMPNPTTSWWITPTVSYSDTVLVDDVGPSKIPKIEEFLEWTDRYPIEFNSKGGFLWWKPKNIVFTSNVPWSEWWPNITERHKAAVLRRIYSIAVVFKDRPEYVVYPNGEDGVGSVCPRQQGPQQAQVENEQEEEVRYQETEGDE